MQNNNASRSSLYRRKICLLNSSIYFTLHSLNSIFLTLKLSVICDKICSKCILATDLHIRLVASSIWCWYLKVAIRYINSQRQKSFKEVKTPFSSPDIPGHKTHLLLHCLFRPLFGWEVLYFKTEFKKSKNTESLEVHNCISRLCDIKTG